ncbi:MAG: hypothetical protein QXV37_04560 [Candidatus Jordarchaeaceae archaeon]
MAIKYHFDGHRADKHPSGIDLCMSPKEAMKIGNICPICRKKMTIGVQHRVEELADRDENYIPKNYVPFKRLIPLTELISAAIGIEDLYAKQIWEIYYKLVTTFKNEYNTLLNASRSDIEAVTNQRIADLIIDNREGRINVRPGFDGVYGKIILDEKEDKGKRPKQVEQKRIDGFFQTEN